MKKLQVFLGAALLLLVTFGSVRSGERPGAKRSTVQRVQGTGPFSTLMNINNLSMWLEYDGSSARNPTTTNAGVTYPRGTATCIFADGLIWGGLVHDGGVQVLRVNGQTYQPGTVGGRIISKGVAEPAGDQSVRIYRIRRDWQTADLRQDAAELNNKAISAVSQADIDAVREQYRIDWVEWPAAKGAPFYDRDGVPGYNPDPAGVYDPTKDEPGVADADQVVWFVMNDLNSAQSQSFLGSNPIGLEVQTTLWGYARTDPLGNVIFKKFRFIYKGTESGSPTSHIDSMFIGQWADPDLGDYSDDFEACDTNLSLGYVYNSSNVDLSYKAFGLAPPAVGYDFFAGPIIASPGDSAVFDLKRRYGYKNLPMTAWIYFAAGGTYSDPPFSYVGAGQWYNLLRGLTPITGAPFVYPGGSQTKFWLSGDPVAHTGYLDGTIDNPGDRREMLSTGPFTMALGDTQEVVVALVAGLGGDYLSSVSVIKSTDKAAQSAYDNLFNLPKPPPNPKLRIANLDRKLVLDWGWDSTAVAATETFNRLGVRFEGYNVYQLPSASADFSRAVRIATYDLPDFIRTIVDTVFDVGLGINVQVIRQRGTDNGIVRFLLDTADALHSGAPLANGQRYYFAVTAYGFSDTSTALSHSSEATLQIVTGIPQSTDPGVRIASRFGDLVPVAHDSGKSDGKATIEVVNPPVLTGKNYQVHFKNVQTTFAYGPDHTGATDTVVMPILHWYLISGTDTLFNGVNQGPSVVIDPGSSNVDPVINPKLGDDFTYPTIDGFFITVKGPPPLLNADRSGGSGADWWTGEFANSRFVVGGPGAAKLRNMATTAADMSNYLGAVGTTLDPSAYDDIEFRFGDGGSLTQNAYRYRRSGTYKYQDYVPVPFQVWDIANPSSPRQLNCGWRDQNNNGAWDPNGGVEVIFVAKSTYDGATPSTYGTTVGSAVNNLVNADVMFAAEWISKNGVQADIKASVIHVSPNYVNSANDIFAFKTPSGATYKGDDIAKNDLTKVNVFPNPYYGFNRAETSRFVRFVTFNHLPPGAWRIRIINLSGTLVRYIDPNTNGQNSGSQFATWDLLNQNGLPAASGIYVAYIEFPKLGVTKTLKLVIIQEQQVLDFY
ncbi:MAG TPA: hypothetical protein VES59_10715 [Bacteroidota bacterium]|nr:hypothetical protein [Bacteroidota bacterium]